MVGRVIRVSMKYKGIGYLLCGYFVFLSHGSFGAFLLFFINAVIGLYAFVVENVDKIKAKLCKYTSDAMR